MQENVVRGEFIPFNASAYKVGIVVAQFNRDITEAMLKSAVEKASEYQLPEKKLNIYTVPGSIEIPSILLALAKTKEYDCLVTIGCVIRGETVHFDYVNKLASEGTQRVSLDHNIPIGFGVLMCESKEQASARVSVGADALVAALESARLIKEINARHG